MLWTNAKCMHASGQFAVCVMFLLLLLLLLLMWADSLCFLNKNIFWKAFWAPDNCSLGQHWYNCNRDSVPAHIWHANTGAYFSKIIWTQRGTGAMRWDPSRNTYWNCIVFCVTDCRRWMQLTMAYHSIPVMFPPGLYSWPHNINYKHHWDHHHHHSRRALAYLPPVTMWDRFSK